MSAGASGSLRDTQGGPGCGVKARQLRQQEHQVLLDTHKLYLDVVRAREL